MEGKEDFILTGQLGEVMRESARAGAVLDPRPRPRTRHHARGVREEHAPHPRPGRRHPQGRSVGRHHDGHRDGQRAHRHPRPQGRGDDRRDHAARAGASHRRAQEQDPRRAPLGRQDGDPAAARTRRTSGTSPRRSASRSSWSSSTRWTRCWRRRSGAADSRSPVKPPEIVEGGEPRGSAGSSRRRGRNDVPAGSDQPSGRCIRATEDAGRRRPPWRRARADRPRDDDGIRDYYATLGVPRDGEPGRHQEGLPQARAAAPPGRQQGEHRGRARFKEINEAYEVLGDPEKRKPYDTLGAELGGIPAGRRGRGRRRPVRADPLCRVRRASTGPGGRPAAGPADPLRVPRHGRGPAGFSDFFRTFFGGGAPRAGRSPARTPAGEARGRTARAGPPPTSTTLLGRARRFDAGSTVRGDRRGGGRPAAGATGAGRRGRDRGRARGGRPRHEAAAPGRRPAARGEDPAGRRERPAHPPARQGRQRPAAGDVYVAVKVRPHPVFTRTAPTSRASCRSRCARRSSGGEVPVETLDRAGVLLRIPPETQARTDLPPGRPGPAALPGEGRGDLYVRSA